MKRNWASAVAAVVAGAGTFALLRWLRGKRQGEPDVDPQRPDWQIDEALEESFPASDPPSWTLGKEGSSFSR
jgi:hypothetical protein